MLVFQPYSKTVNKHIPLNHTFPDYVLNRVCWGFTSTSLKHDQFIPVSTTFPAWKTKQIITMNKISRTNVTNFLVLVRNLLVWTEGTQIRILKKGIIMNWTNTKTLTRTTTLWVNTRIGCKYWYGPISAM